MKELFKIYDQIIFESRFKNKKWTLSGKFKDTEIFENIEHLSDLFMVFYGQAFLQYLLQICRCLRLRA